MGSIPYVTVLPMKGNQWKTTGGLFAFLNRTCDSTFTTTETEMKVRKAVKTNAVTDRPESRSASGWIKFESRPMMKQEARDSTKKTGRTKIEGEDSRGVKFEI
jgi:hypothetical protein